MNQPDPAGMPRQLPESSATIAAGQRRGSDSLLRQRHLFEKAPGFIAVLRGPDHVFEFVNEAYVRLAGTRDYIGKSVREAIPEMETQGYVGILDTVYRTGTRHVAENARIILKPRPENPSEEHYVDFVYEPLLNEFGKATAIFIEGFEVPNPQVANSPSHGPLRAQDRVWTHARDLLVVIDADGMFRAVSPGWTRVLGHFAHDVTGHCVSEFVHPDDADATREALRRAATAGDLTHFENRLVHHDGSTCWISWNTSVEAGLVYGYGRDITAEKHSAQALTLAQNRLRAVFETTYLFQGLITPTGTLLEANSRALSAIRRTLEDVAGKPLWDTPWFSGTPGLADLVERGVRAAAAGELVQHEIQVNLPSGGRRWFDFALRPVRDHTGSVVAIVPEALELTERKQTEAALLQSQKLEAMGQLTGGVAHDFNNLLVPIIGSLDMLCRRGIGGEREDRLIRNAVKSAERAKVLVQRLLAFARRQPLQPIAVEVGSLINEIAGLIASTTGPRINVVVDIEPHLPTAKADPNQLEMAIVNLSMNARDAMPEGGTLRISANAHAIAGPHRTALEPGRYVCLSVVDTGVGMDAATLAHAIEPFFSTKGIGKGTGLGLSMVHGLASQLGGALFIWSKQGEGTQVELWLPVTSESLDTAPVGIVTAAPVHLAGTALLVDDEEMIRISTADMLHELGLNVIEASSAPEALQVLRRGDLVDIVVTDHLMPGMTGVDLAKTVLSERPRIPVLIVSGFAEVDALPAFLPRLSKPFRQAELAAMIHRLLERQQKSLH
jgi:PAS domain S-box-containing protein